jgi:carboxypeptidase Taq|tara:strand:- start:1613 stop:3130 length:1518 start_codon:yes stop_codon:yes gene_type:complete
MLDQKPSNARPAYDALSARFKRLGVLEGALGQLQWDMSAVMPTGGAETRGEQLATLEVMAHEIITQPETADLLDQAESDELPDLSDWQQANLREMRHGWRHATALDAGLVEALAKAGKACEMVWREARPQSDFARVQPLLAEVLRLSQEAGQAKAQAFGVSLYDALLDQYEPAMTAARIDEIFDPLADFLPDFLQAALTVQAARPAPLPLEGPFPIAKQEALAHKLMRAVGFDFDHGRLDTSAHPFCGGVPDDVRITTRYDEADFTTAMMGVLHETGHALYERGLPKAWRYQPVGAARGMALHESQSLLVEMQACRSPEFLSFMAPLAREAFGGAGPAWSADNLRALTTRVAPGFIRVDADEVTYPAHIILRYRLEKALLSGDLPLAELPAAWNAGMQQLLGITPPADRLGCLQDIHWYDGAWGYFPTYSLGAMIAAQLFAKAKQDRPDIPSALARGDFSGLMAWLGEKVHSRASFHLGETLVEEATGEPLNPGIFEAHLTHRYL